MRFQKVIYTKYKCKHVLAKRESKKYIEMTKNVHAQGQ